jgi:hypothetical protein
MTATELRATLGTLDLRQHQAARLLGVTIRAVGMWINEEREIPGPVAAYFNLLMTLPAALRVREFARIQENAEVFDGMYLMEFSSGASTGIAPPELGLGVLVFQDGRIFGSDSRVSYDGDYAPTGRQGEVAMKVRVSVPPGVNVPLIQGVMSGHEGFSFDVGPQNVDLGRSGGTIVTVMTPIGPPDNRAVTVRLTKLRNLPD